MFWRMVRGTLFRQKSKMLMIAFTVALGVSLATAMMNVMLGVGDKVNKELKTYGANITVMHKDASILDDLYGLSGEGVSNKFLSESEVPKIKQIFWGFAIVDFAPYLERSGEKEVDAGIKNLKTWWEVKGEWLKDDDLEGVMIGSLIAGKNNIKIGDTINVKGTNETKKLTVRGIINSGGDDDEAIYTVLKTTQDLFGLEDKITMIEVSALTTPDNDLARKAARSPLSLTIKEMEIWYCTAYVSSICYQIQEVMTDAVAKPIRQVAESEGAILNKTTLLMLLITVLSLIASALGISNLVTASVMDRRAEIGLKKAIGASNTAVTISVLTEVMVIGIIGGAAGYFIGLGLTQIIGRSVFGSAIPPAPMVIPIVVLIIFLITLLGSFPSVKYLLKLNPTEVLHGK